LSTFPELQKTSKTGIIGLLKWVLKKLETHWNQTPKTWNHLLIKLESILESTLETSS